MRQLRVRLIAANAAVAASIVASGCATKLDDATRISDHKAAIAKVSPKIISQCQSSLNEKPFGVIGNAEWKFLEPLAPDDRLACLYAGHKIPFQIQSAFYSARIEQVSGWPGKVGLQTLYWCRVAINPDTNVAILSGYQVGLWVKDDANIFQKEGSVELAKKCGLPMERAKTIVDVLLPAPTASTARP
jgi:hypothetical protein